MSIQQEPLFIRKVSPGEAGETALEALIAHFGVLRNEHKRSTHEAILASLENDDIKSLFSIALKYAFDCTDFDFFHGLEDFLDDVRGEISRFEDRVADGKKTGQRMGKRKKAEKEAADRSGNLFDEADDDL